ncbi:hypothetical protein SADUNF_Sadunf05G0139000 [Salix dunnii]|uniref:Legume lectin domain-containing protein n=1 Tax=Salix dunnii TaxID=1413687 RepID=A0A835MZB4_9ROSI|nr:hypothetical protein SADUNF_Sadunf05G0139000 [Salix dunnii]
MLSSSFLLLVVYFFLLFDFSFPSLSVSFLPARNVTLYGDAHLKNNAISLTQQHACPASSSSSSSNGVGKALYLYPIRFLDPINNTTASFFCRFSFSIIRSPLCSFGDGMAFLITSNADSFSLSKGYMGLPGPALNPQDSFIAVEFDTSSDPSLGDISSNHIGIDVNSIVSFAAIDAESVGIDLQSGRQITAWIEYSDSSKLIQVWASYLQVRPPSPILVAQVDLSEHFKEYMHVGFSASNGQGSAIHNVDQWRFKTYATLSSATPTDMSEKGDCLMCYPENPIYNYGPGTHNGRGKLLEMALGLGGLAAFTVSIFVVLFVVIFSAIKKRRGVGGRTKEGRIDRVSRRLSITEIRSATMGFHRSRIIGQGASATVFKGYLSSCGSVAVKRFDHAGIECAHNPFITEFAAMVGMFNRLEVERMLMVGLSCVHPNHEKRPTVKEAAMILRGEAPLPVLPQRKPAVGFQSVLSEDSDGTLNLAGDNSPCTDDLTWMTPRNDFG